MNYMQNVWKLYAVRFFYSLIPAYVIERLFWEQRGMTIQMVVYTEIIYAITIVFLEIPTGIIADKWGRKKMVVLNAFLGCCGIFILVFSTKFWHFAVVAFLAGIGGSACSGAENALLYDSLLKSGKEQSFEKHLGRLKMYEFLAIILAALSGSLMANRFGFEFNYWVSFVGMFISLCISLVLVEPDIQSEIDMPIPIKEYIKASVNFFGKNPSICIVLLSGMVIGSALNFIDEFWQLYISRLGVPVIYFGLFLAALSFLRLPGNIIAYAIKNRFSYRVLLSAVVFVFTVGFLYLSVVKDYTSLGMIFLISIVSGIIEPIVTGYLHHRIDSSMRATIDSFQSLGSRAVLIVVGLGFGFFSSKFDIFGGYGFISFICGVFFVYFLASSKDIIQ